MAKRAASHIPPGVPVKMKPTPWGTGTTMFRVHETNYSVWVWQSEDLLSGR